MSKAGNEGAIERIRTIERSQFSLLSAAIPQYMPQLSTNDLETSGALLDNEAPSNDIDKEYSYADA